MSIRSKSLSSRTPAFLRMRRSSVISSFVSAMVPNETHIVRLKPAPASSGRTVHTESLWPSGGPRSNHGDDAESLGRPVHRSDVCLGWCGLADLHPSGPRKRISGDRELHARSRVLTNRRGWRRRKLVHDGDLVLPSRRHWRDWIHRVFLPSNRRYDGSSPHRLEEPRRRDSLGPRRPRFGGGHAPPGLRGVSRRGRPPPPPPRRGGGAKRGPSPPTSLTQPRARRPGAVGQPPPRPPPAGGVLPPPACN